MIEDIVGNNGTRFIIAAGAVALGLLCLVVVLRFLRNRPSSPFIRGGKNRQPRLAVLDAAAIDTRRRLVLVRRDDVEHLIMIGGPTDVVIESRIAAAAQPATIPATVTQDTVVARVQAERPVPDRALPERPVERAVPERRVAPQPETRPTPVSAMGQVLYGEGADIAPQPVRAAQPSSTRSQPETAVRQPQPERIVPVQSQQPPPQPVTSTALPQPVATVARSPEDILDAARNRVLAANQPVSGAQRPQSDPTPVVAAAHSAVSTPAQTPPIGQNQPAVASQRETSAAEFERILDAEITGDLGKLTVDDIRLEAEQRTNPANTTIRQEPRLSTAPGGRNEPSLEDEMNRMLSEIAVNRKS